MNGQFDEWRNLPIPTVPTLPTAGVVLANVLANLQKIALKTLFTEGSGGEGS